MNGGKKWRVLEKGKLSPSWELSGTHSGIVFNSVEPMFYSIGGEKLCIVKPDSTCVAKIQLPFMMTGPMEDALRYKSLMVIQNRANYVLMVDSEIYVHGLSGWKKFKLPFDTVNKHPFVLDDNHIVIPCSDKKSHANKLITIDISSGNTSCLPVSTDRAFAWDPVKRIIYLN